MEKIKNVLGLWVHNESIMDRFDMVFIKNFVQPVYKKLNSSEGICPAEEAGPLERRVKVLGNEEEKAYKKALRLLVELRPEYGKYPSKRGKKKKVLELSELLKKKMRLTVWVATGNVIPFRELKEVLVKNLLKAKGYAYRRKKGEMGWYRDGFLFVGENLYAALKHLEDLEAVDRSRLTIGF